MARCWTYAIGKVFLLLANSMKKIQLQFNKITIQKITITIQKITISMKLCTKILHNIIASSVCKVLWIILNIYKCIFQILQDRAIVRAFY